MSSSRPVSELSVEELLELAKGRARLSPDVVKTGSADVYQEWLKHTGLEPGSHPGISSSDLLRHLNQWSEAQGISHTLTVTKLARELKLLGCARGRQTRDGRDEKPYLMSWASAKFFNAWLEQNPPAPLGQNPDAPSARWKRNNEQE